MSNFCYFLDRAGVLGHTLLLTTHNASWHLLNAKGFPVILDRVFPEREEYQRGVQPGDTPNRWVGGTERCGAAPVGCSSSAGCTRPGAHHSCCC